MGAQISPVFLVAVAVLGTRMEALLLTAEGGESRQERPRSSSSASAMAIAAMLSGLCWGRVLAQPLRGRSCRIFKTTTPKSP